MKHKKALLITLFLSLITTSSGVHATYFMRNVLWSSTSIEVCFVDRPQYILEQEKDLDVARTYLEKPSYQAGVSPFIPFAQERIAPFSQDKKNFVRDVLTRSVSAAGLTLTGWRSCDETPNAQIALVHSNYAENYEVAAAGTTGDPAKKYNYGAPPLKRINSIRVNEGLIARDRRKIADKIKLVMKKYPAVRVDAEAVADRWAQHLLAQVLTHELGHVLGLTHEYSRLNESEFERYGHTFMHPTQRDWRKNKRDIAISSWVLKDIASEREGLGHFGGYDLLSIMDYWWLFNIDELAALDSYCQFIDDKRVCDQPLIDRLIGRTDHHNGYFSQQDIRTLRALYLGERYQQFGLRDYINDRAFQNWAQAVRSWGSSIFKADE